MTMAVKQTGQPSFLEALLPKGAGVNATRVSLLRKPKVSMANKTYGTVSPERQKEMSGLEFVKDFASGTLPLNTIARRSCDTRCRGSELRSGRTAWVGQQSSSSLVWVCWVRWLSSIIPHQ